MSARGPLSSYFVMSEEPLNSDQEEQAIFCMHCGTRNVDVEYACDRCGERVYVPDTSRPPPLGFTSCTNCRAANESHASYCAACGLELDHSARISPDGTGSGGDEEADRGRNGAWGSISRSGFGGGRRDDQSPVGGGDVPIRRPSQWGLPKRSNRQRQRRRQIPQEIRRWNWSAFILGPIWGLSHGIWWSALGLLPFLPILPRQLTIATWVLVAVLLGLKGNELAWRARRWESVERFLAVQQRWMTWSVIFAIGSLLAVIVFLLSQ